MKPMALPLALAVAMMVSPGASQTPPPPADAPGVDLMEEGARLLFRGLMREMEPALTEMGKALSEMEPALTELMALIDDIRNYEAPRVLDNGDILIPRRPDAPPRPGAPDPPAAAPGGEIEL